MVAGYLQNMPPRHALLVLAEHFTHYGSHSNNVHVSLINRGPAMCCIWHCDAMLWWIPQGVLCMWKQLLTA